jgi:hypothetical protein
LVCGFIVDVTWHVDDTFLGAIMEFVGFMEANHDGLVLFRVHGVKWDCFVAMGKGNHAGLNGFWNNGSTKGGR